MGKGKASILSHGSRPFRSSAPELDLRSDGCAASSITTDGTFSPFQGLAHFRTLTKKVHRNDRLHLWNVGFVSSARVDSSFDASML